MPSYTQVILIVYNLLVVMKVFIMIVSTLIRSGSELNYFEVGWQKKCVDLLVLSSHVVLKLAAAGLVDLAG